MIDWRRVQLGVAALVAVMVVGTCGYLVLGFGALDALYQTVTTVTTVGFREVHPLSSAGKAFTIVLILVGVGTALYTLTVLMETLLEGQLRGGFGRRRMEKRVRAMNGPVIVCGWGRVGRVIARELTAAGKDFVVVEMDPARIDDTTVATVLGDATEDAVLEEAGVRRASALVAALDNDAGNLFVTVSARSFAPKLFIVSRVRTEENEQKLRRAGADRIINPQSIGGARAAAFLLQPHVTEFLDVVMRDRDIEFRLEELAVPADSPLVAHTISDARIRDQTGALVLALREPDGSFVTNPGSDHVLTGGQVLIAIGTKAELGALELLAAGSRPTD